MSLSIAVAHGGRPWSSWAHLVGAELRGRYRAFVVDLPVTTEAAVHGGIDILGFPKWLARIDFTEEGERRICTVREHGALVLQVVGERLPTRDAPKEISLESYPRKEGSTLHAVMRMRLGAWASSMLSRKMTIEAGAGPRAAAIRSLGLGRQIDYLYAPRCEAILFRPEAVS